MAVIDRVASLTASARMWTSPLSPVDVEAGRLREQFSYEDLLNRVDELQKACARVAASVCTGRTKRHNQACLEWRASSQNDGPRVSLGRELNFASFAP
jgi:hypothetical protein